MDRTVIWLQAGVAAALLSTVDVAHAVDVALEAVPKPVMETVTARFADIKVVGAATEKNEAGQMVYEITLDDNGMNIDATLTPEGSLVLIEKQVMRKDLPEASAKVLEQKYPKARYRIVEQVFDVKEKQESLAFYEVLLVTPQKQIRAVEVSSEGKILKVEKKTSEEDNDED